MTQLTKEQVLSAYAEQGTDIVADVEFRQQAIEMTKFTLAAVQNGLVKVDDEARKALESLLGILESL